MKILLKSCFLYSNSCDSGADQRTQFKEDCICDVEMTLGGPKAPLCFAVGEVGGVASRQQSRPQLGAEFPMSYSRSADNMS